MPSNMRDWALSLLIVTVCLGGCATVVRGTEETFVVETLPAGARVTTSLGNTCDASPCTFRNVPREASFTVTVELDGYRPETLAVSHRLTGGGLATASAVVMPAFGLAGVVIDANSGATRSLTPNPLHVHLTPSASH